MQACSAGHVEIGFVNRRHLDQRRERSEYAINLFRALAIPLRMAVYEDGMRAKLGRRAQRHGRMNSKFTRFVGGSRDYAPLVALASHHHGFAFEGRIEQLFHRDEERVHVYVEDGFGEPRHRSTGKRLLKELYQWDRAQRPAACESTSPTFPIRTTRKPTMTRRTPVSGLLALRDLASGGPQSDACKAWPSTGPSARTR